MAVLVRRLFAYDEQFLAERLSAATKLPWKAAELVFGFLLHSPAAPIKSDGGFLNPNTNFSGDDVSL